MTIILHLLSDHDHRALDPTVPYRAASLATEGFVHCTGDDETLLHVANAFYRQSEGDLVVLSLDVARIGSPVVWEAPTPTPPPGARDDVLFPHVYGPIDLAAVVLVRRLRRDPSGCFEGYDPRT